MYKYFNKKLPSNFVNYFTDLNSIHRYDTRQKTNLKLYLPRTRTKFGQKALLFSGIKAWQTLPIKLTQKKEVHSFSKAVIQYILDKYK